MDLAGNDSKPEDETRAKYLRIAGRFEFLFVIIALLLLVAHVGINGDNDNLAWGSCICLFSSIICRAFHSLNWHAYGPYHRSRHAFILFTMLDGCNFLSNLHIYRRSYKFDKVANIMDVWICCTTAARNILFLSCTLGAKIMLGTMRCNLARICKFIGDLTKLTRSRVLWIWHTYFIFLDSSARSRGFPNGKTKL